MYPKIKIGASRPASRSGTASLILATPKYCAPFCSASPGNFNGTVAVAVGFDDGHQAGRRTGDASQLPDVVCIGPQIDFSPGYWMIQNIAPLVLILK